MIGLWSDLQKLTKAQFEEEIGKLTAAASNLLDQRTATPNRKEGRSLPAPKGDRPAYRVAWILTTKANLPEHEAMGRLRDALQDLGIEPKDLPPVQQRPLSSWLEDLMRQVPAALVTNAAQQVVTASLQD